MSTKSPDLLIGAQEGPAVDSTAGAELEFSHLTLPQVFSWIMERDLQRIRELPEEISLTEFRRDYVLGREHKVLNARPSETSSPSFANVRWENIPIKREQREFLSQEHLQLDLLQSLPSAWHGAFAEMLARHLCEWHRSEGHNFFQAQRLAKQDLDELESWFAKQGIAVPFNRLAEEHVRFNERIRAEADTERRKAETSLVKNLAAGKITAVGLRNGTGDPEEIPAIHWPLLAFSDRDFDQRGTIPCAVVKSDPEGAFWSDLRFNTEKVLSIWNSPAGSTSESRPVTHPIMQQRRRQSPQFDRAQAAILALYPNGVPDQTQLRNKELQTAVEAQIAKMGFKPIGIDTIIRAAGRRK
jgi:hypothetical protein